jgi:demethylmacrocin O-methyltransferase
MTLSDLAIKHGTDKWCDYPEGHHYTLIYEELFSKYKDLSFTLWECGVGGYEFPDKGGGSLLMWRDWFKCADVHGIDIHYKKPLVNVSLHQFSQDDKESWDKLLLETGEPTIFIDDASHINPLTIRTFEIVFPMLKSGGVYVIEDAHTSHWNLNYNGSDNYKDMEAHTSINYFRKMVNELNAQHLVGFIATDIGQSIKSISFYKELIVIHKK